MNGERKPKKVKSRVKVSPNSLHIQLINPNATKSNKIQQAHACSGVADCCGLPPVGFTWHVEGPGIEPGSVRDNNKMRFWPLPIIFVETPPQSKVMGHLFLLIPTTLTLPNLTKSNKRAYLLVHAHLVLMT